MKSIIPVSVQVALILLFGNAWIGSARGEDANAGDVALEKTPVALKPGTHLRKLTVGNDKRSAYIHVPPNYDPDRPTPLILAMHGATMDGIVMMGFTGLNQTSDKYGFVVVYPNGTGVGPLLTWNAGGFTEGFGTRADDVGFVKQLLQEVGTVINVDADRVYACGMSNGAMMCYRLAAEMSNTFAAIAPVSGTMPQGEVQFTRPLSVLHFHGTLDTLVPYELNNGKTTLFLKLRSVEETAATCAMLDGCDSTPSKIDVLSKEADELKITRKTFGPGKDDTEVILITIEGGGHTWPGEPPPVKFIGKSAMTISANEMMWEFFQKHPLKRPVSRK